MYFMAQFEYESPSDVFPATIKTNRLIFKRISYDVLNIREIYNRYSSVTTDETKFVKFSPHSCIKESYEWMNSSIDKFDSGESAGYFLFTIDTNGDCENFIGTASFDPTWERNIAESGIFLFKKYWGNEYSKERGEAMLTLAFEELDFDWWISKCHADNTASARAIEKYVVKNGGKRVGVLPNSGVGMSETDSLDHLLYFKLSQQSYLSD